MNKMATAKTEPATAQAGIPLDLAPLLSPYAHYRRLSIRIEQLPPQARLSKGSNNGDRTWSLKPDDLDGLEFLLPEGKDVPISLAIRIIGIDDDDEATILAQFDLPLSPSETVSMTSAVAKAASPIVAADPEARWQEQYETRLADIAKQLELEWEQKTATEQTARESAEAKAAASAKKLTELTKQLEAASGMAAKAEAAQDRNMAEQQARHDKALQQQAKKAEAHFTKELDRNLVRAQSKWDKERDKQIAGAAKQAMQASTAEAEARLEQAQAQWLEESAREIETAHTKTAQAEAALEAFSQNNESLLKGLRDEIAESAAAHAKRESDLADAHKEIDRAQTKSEKEREKQIAGAVKQAVQASEAEAKARLEQERARWQEESNREIAAAHEKSAQAKAALEVFSGNSETQLQALRDDVAGTAAALASRESDLANAHKEMDRAQAKSEKEREKQIVNAVKQAVQTSEAEAQARLEQARAQWLEESKRETDAAKENSARMAAALEERSHADVNLLQGLRDEITETKATLAKRETELADAQKETDRAQTKSEKEVEKRIASAVKQAAQASEAEAEAQLEQALALWQTESNREIEAANDKCARAEAALEKLSHNDGTLQQSLRAELTEALAALARRETELADAHRDTERDQAKWENALEARIAEAVSQALQTAGVEADARLEQVRAHWQEEANLAIEAANEKAALARTALERSSHNDDASEQGLRQELAETAAILAKRESELADSQREPDRAQVKWQSELETRIAEAVSQAQRTAGVEAEAGLEQARAHWQEEANLAIEAANEKAALARAALEESSHNDEASEQGLRHELAETTAILAKRESELAESHHERDRAQVKWQRELETRIAEAVQTTEADAEAALQVLGDKNESQLQGLHHELAETKAALAARETELADARRDAKRAEAQAPAPTIETELAAARRDWQAELDERLADVEGRTAAQLEENRTATQTETAAQESIEQAHQRWTDDAQATLANAQQEWQAEEAKRLAAARADWQKNARTDHARGAVTDVAKKQRRSRVGRRLKRITVIAACLIAAVLLYANFGPMIAERWGPTIAELKDSVAPLIDTLEDKAQSELQLLSDATKPHMAVAVKIANVRAGPSTATAVITKLPQNTRVTVLEQKGDWIQIRLVENGVEQGWLHRSLLKDSTDR